MQVVLLLLGTVAVIVGWTWACLRAVKWLGARARYGGTPADAGLPHGHRPPPGLGPLSPSERFLTQESSRGLRELERFLAEQRMV